MLSTELFSSNERIRLVKVLFYNPDLELKVRNIARLSKVSPALVTGTIAILKEHGLIKEGRVDLLRPSIRALKILLNIETFDSVKLVQKTRNIFKDCKGIGLYGSWANGTNTKESDLDLWIKSETAGEEKTIKTRNAIKKELELEANVIVLTKKRLNELKEKDFVFYSMLYNSFLLWGEGI